MQAAPPQRAERGAEHRGRGVAERRHRDQHRGPAEQRGVAARHPLEQSGIERDREQHQVAERRAGDPELEQQPTILLAALGLAIEPAIRVYRVAEPVEVARDIGQLAGVGIPHHVGPRAPEVELDVDEPGHAARCTLDQPHARGAPEVLEIERGPQAMVVRSLGRVGDQRPNVDALERGIVELGVAARRRARRCR